MIRAQIRFLILATPIVITSSIFGFAYFHQNRIFEVILAGYIALTLIIGALLVMIVGGIRNKGKFFGSWLGIFSILLMLGGFSVFFSPFPGDYFHEQSLSKSKEILEQQIPKIESFYEENGYYPSSLIEISITDFGRWLPKNLNNDHLFQCDPTFLGNKPRFMHRPSADNNYRSNGEQYELCVSHLDEISATGSKSVYSSIEKSWEIKYIYSSGSWD